MYCIKVQWKPSILSAYKQQVAENRDKIQNIALCNAHLEKENAS